MSLEQINEVNETIYGLQQRGLAKFRKLEALGSREILRQHGSRASRATAFVHNGDHMVFNNQQCRSKTVFKRYCQGVVKRYDGLGMKIIDDERILQDLKNTGASQWEINRITARLEARKKSKLFGRWGTPYSTGAKDGSLKGVINHESGHVFDDIGWQRPTGDVMEQRAWGRKLRRIAKKVDESTAWKYRLSEYPFSYSGTVSRYNEIIAESLSAWELGEVANVHPEFRSFFGRYLK